MDENNKEELYSAFHGADIQEIMGRQPVWILRWGITILIMIIVGSIVACCFIKSPQTINAPIILTSERPPSDLVAKYSGILDSVFVSDGASVETGQLLALIANAASYEDILKVETFLSKDTLMVAPDGWQDYVLGEVQTAWSEYIAALTDYDDYVKIDRIGNKKGLLVGQVWQTEKYHRLLEAQRELIVEIYELERVSLNRDSILLSQNVIPQAEYDSSRKALISRLNAIAEFDANMANTHLGQLQLEQQILELETQQTSEVADYTRRISQARTLLISQIVQWRDQYAIIAPYDGVVSLQNVWTRGQHVSVGDLVASVSPIGEAWVQGRIKVPSIGFGKVEVGQEVLIKLNGFPFTEYGILKGRVDFISKVPERTADGLLYTVVVSLPSGLESSYHRIFPFVQNMDGLAEIVIEDMRLIDYFSRPIKSLFVNR